jgi:hypothetical protein
MKKIKAKLNVIGQKYFGSELSKVVTLKESENNDMDYVVLVLFKSGQYILSKSRKSKEQAMKNCISRLQWKVKNYGTHVEGQKEVLKRTLTWRTQRIDWLEKEEVCEGDTFERKQNCINQEKDRVVKLTERLRKLS